MAFQKMQMLWHDIINKLLLCCYEVSSIMVPSWASIKIHSLIKIHKIILYRKVCAFTSDTFNVRIDKFNNFKNILPLLSVWRELIKITLKPYKRFFKPLAHTMGWSEWNPRYFLKTLYRVWHCRKRLSIIVYVTLHSTPFNLSVGRWLEVLIE